MNAPASCSIASSFFAGSVAQEGTCKLILYEEVVEVAGDEPRSRGLLDDDVDNVPTVEIARLAEERLLTVVVVIFDELEIGRVVAHRVE